MLLCVRASAIGSGRLPAYSQGTLLPPLTSFITACFVRFSAPKRTTKIINTMCAARAREFSRKVICHDVRRSSGTLKLPARVWMSVMRHVDLATSPELA